MRASTTIAWVCSALPGIVLEVRQSVPLTWQGVSGQEFTARNAELTAEIESVSTQLAIAGQLAYLHEIQMQTMRLALQGGNG